MATILCLAHYCDTHGPTPCIVTVGLPVPCSLCLEQHDEGERPQSGRRALSSPEADEMEALRRSLQCEEDMPPPTTQPPRHSFSPAVDTPPESPRLTALQVKRGGSNTCRDSSFRRTYDENDRRRAVPCENCALTLPKKVQEQVPQDPSGSPSKKTNFDNVGPTLRTRKAYERLSRRADRSSPKSTPSDSDESERDPSRSRGLKRTATCSSASSFSSSSSHSHRHYLDYTSTHDPISSASFSAIRASCLRTLSCETLPPNNHVNNSPTSPTSPLSWQPNRSFPTIPAPATSTSGGPIFFGDPQAGYTTAYIFRIPDAYARGRRRVYAFICLSKAHERTAMRAFSYLSAAFADISSWIQSMAEVEADRLDAATAPAPVAYMPPSIHTLDGSAPVSFAPASLAHDLPHSVPTLPHPSSSPSPPSPRTMAPDVREDGKGKRRASTFAPPPPQLRTSAFLAGRPFDPDSFARRGPMGQIRSRGLAELVGQPDFFIQLHARFVALLAQLAVLSANGSS